MRVLAGYVFPEPPENVLQGSCIGDWPLGNQQDETWRGPVLQGKSLSDPTGDSVPRAMVGWVPYFGQANSIGPMATQGGAVGMVAIGRSLPANPIIDAPQRFLSSALPIDATGAWVPQDVVLGYSEVQNSRILPMDSPLAYPMPLASPRREVADSGLLKVITAPTLVPEFGAKVYPGPISYQSFALSGTTTDGTGAAIPGCRVVVRETSRMRTSDEGETVAETVSDGSGLFSVPVRNKDYQITAYKAGSPDKSGVSRDNVTPIASTTVYLRDPTAPDSAGAGSGMSRGRVVNA